MQKILILLLLSVVVDSIAQVPNSESNFQKYFDENSKNLSSYDGIWSMSLSIYQYSYYTRQGRREKVESPPSTSPNIGKLAIITKNTKTNIYTLEGNIFPLIEIIPTASLNNFFCKFNKSNESTIDGKGYFVDKNTFRLVFEFITPGIKDSKFSKLNPSDNYAIATYEFTRTYPLKFSYFNTQPENSSVVSGTGFAISSNGLITTNYHVIENAKEISIKGINENFSKSYLCELVVEDRNNDLAIIKIKEIVDIGEIPFSKRDFGVSVGENVFTLGYPLRSSMGDEIKLTNGIISSKTGYKGDISSFQLSVPVQPGNSGGPLFDIDGNLIAIINSKHTEAENATYSIKVNNLNNLLELIPNAPNMQNGNFLKGKTLTEQTKILKKFIYIVEVKL